MRARHLLVPAVLMLAPVGAPASGQVLPAPGSTVRVTTGVEPGLLVGRVTNVEAGGFEMVDEGGTTHRVDLNEVLRVEIHEMRRNTWRGAFIGAGAGLIVGLVVSQADDCEGESLGICEAFEAPAEGIATALLTLAGGGVGAIVGHQIVSRRWVDAPVAQPRGELMFGLRVPLGFWPGG